MNTLIYYYQQHLPFTQVCEHQHGSIKHMNNEENHNDDNNSHRDCNSRCYVR